MKLTLKEIVTVTLVTISKMFLKELEELEIKARAEIIQITALFRSARLLRRVLEP